ncbi:FecR family protein [Mucilaginibacter pineti]|uniref:FecR family protein n=1 Tax=Mucilaginibacter pineti TaxID=1391627 RepID=A0A1G6WVC0_9SPHI|nr:FecR family protein [Mucilaginibacter pineti]SDD69739.1 FecR family protein [Mucilaginibacter pineti]
MNELQKEYFVGILTKYRLGTATKEEINFLETYYNTFELSEDLITDENEESYLQLKDSIKLAVDKRITPRAPAIVTSLRFAWVKYAAAALILISLTIGGFLLVRKNNKQQLAANEYKGIVPGSNKAMLTLANGKRIALDDATKGEIAKQAGITITKTADGQIVYQAARNTGSDEAFQNTISTPKGGQYKVILPDGTQVWLNAASSLSYPTLFKGNERMVTLNGEAYFEVTKNPAMPFRVKSGVQLIQVLGTHFNVNAYADESTIKTTLLEGAVKITAGANTSIIAPGQQTEVNQTGEGAIAKHQVDVDKETAWKNGVFSFAGDDIRSVMRQVCRWYNIDVVYGDNLPKEKYYGEISRNSSLGGIFRILELNNVKFEVEGKTVKVSSAK